MGPRPAFNEKSKGPTIYVLSGGVGEVISGHQEFFLLAKSGGQDIFSLFFP